MIDNNVAQAAIRAGYTPAAARNTGYRLMQREDVQRWIAEAQSKTMAKLEITRDSVIEELAKLAFSNPMDFGRIENGQFIVDLSQATRDQFAAVTELTARKRTVGAGDDARVEHETKLKLANKREALVDIGRHLGIFRDDGGSELTVVFNILGREPKGKVIEHDAR